MRRSLVKSLLPASILFLALVGPVLAWQVHIYWVGHPATNPASPREGYLDGMIKWVSGNRWVYAEDSYTWWTSTAKTWILNNRGSDNRYQEALVFHVFKPNSNDGCLSVVYYDNYYYSNLPGHYDYFKRTCVWPTWVPNEVRIFVGAPSALKTGSSNPYYAQPMFQDTSPYDRGEVANDSYWVDSVLQQGLKKDYLTKFCFYTDDTVRAPVSGVCP